MTDRQKVPLKDSLQTLPALWAALYPEAGAADRLMPLCSGPAADGLVMLDKPVGACAFLLVQVAADQADIIEIGTHPACRRQGLARDLLTTYFDVAAGKGISDIFLEVAVDNLPAYQLYLQSGFVEIGRRNGYYRRGETVIDAVQMHKPILSQ